MRKLFTLTLALLASFSMWAETVTMDCALSKGSTPSPSIGVALLNGGAFDGSGYKLGSDGNYIGWNISAANRTFSAITFNGYINTNSTDKNWGFQFSTDGGTTWGAEVTQANDGTKSYHDINVSVSIPSGANAVRIIRRAGTSSYVSSITLTLTPNCEAPENALVLNANKTSDIYAGDEITFSTTGGNGGAITIEGADSETITANKWIAIAGTHTFTASQAKNGDYCEQESEIVLNVASATPVTACSIEGPAAGYIGDELTYTATAANATAFAWYVDDDLQEGETDAEFVYTGVKGNHSIYATATNAYTATPVASDPIALTVTKLCGELIKAVYDPSSKTSTVTGVVGGTADRNTYDNGKLGSNGHYYGVKLTSGSFMAGDVVTVVASVLNGGNNATIYADKTGTTLLGSKEFDTESLSAEITLTTSADVVYLYRKDSGCNPNIASLSVTRSCEDSNDANIKSLTINGEEIAEDEGVFSYTVSAAENLAQVAVTYTIHPLATATPASGFNVNVPTAGDPANTQVITVTAEDGTQKEYTVSVAKATSLNNDATLKELSVAGLTLAPAFDAETTAYTVTKAYEAAMPAVGDVTATANDANAKSVDVALAGNVFTITVTAEDNTTTKDYTITVNNAPAIKSLSRVLFSNGFDAFIDNTNRTVKAFYLDGTVAPTATTITAGANCTAGSIEDGKIVVTGADESFVEYAVTLEAVTANTNVVEESAAAGTFDGTEAWVKNGLLVYGNAAGFANNKYVLRRQHKGADPADDQRAIAGWVRTYFFVGNASKLQLTVTDNKKLKYAIDGGNYTASDDASTLEINLEAGNHMIEIVTNQQSGDCTLSAPKLVKRTPTAINNTADEIKAVKFIENGQLFIRRGEKVYTITGEEVK